MRAAQVPLLPLDLHDAHGLRPALALRARRGALTPLGLGLRPSLREDKLKEHLLDHLCLYVILHGQRNSIVSIREVFKRILSSYVVDICRFAR